MSMTRDHWLEGEDFWREPEPGDSEEYCSRCQAGFEAGRIGQMGLCEDCYNQTMWEHEQQMMMEGE